MDRAKPFDIPKREVWEAYKRVRANQGAAGVDGQSIADFEADLANNLYKLWNWMSSGSYFPPPVRRVDIPKSDGKTRPLGIPTVADRIAQMVVKRHLEPMVEPVFHPNSYGYRPGKSALDAVGAARQRCWRYDWVLDLDIKGFFDSIEPELADAGGAQAHGLPVGASVHRQMAEGAGADAGRKARRARTRNAARRGDQPPPGKSLSSLCVRHVDARNFPDIPFERYADDAICHCRTEGQAVALRAALDARFADCGLTLHPDKTKIVYCRDESRRDTHPIIKFDFLGYTFRPRLVNKRAGGIPPDGAQGDPRNHP